MAVSAVTAAVPPARYATWLGLGRRLDPADPQAARHVAAQFVSELFYKPLLAELHASPWGAAFASGGQTEAVFGQQLEERLADTAARTGGGLVDQIAAQLRGGRA